MSEKFTNEEISELTNVLVKEAAKGNKEKFGRAIGASGVTVSRWMEGISIPSKMKIKSLLAMKKYLENYPKNPEGALTEPFVAGKIKDDEEGIYEKMGQTKPYSKMEDDEKTAREIADEVYRSLSPETRCRIDAKYAAIVMEEKAKDDYLKEGRGYD